jgi:hypothetical protein
MIEFEDIDRVVEIIDINTGNPHGWLEKAGISDEALEQTTKSILVTFAIDGQAGVDLALNLKATVMMAFMIGWEVRDQIGRG